jgi:phenolic acid decarboxylase
MAWRDAGPTDPKLIIDELAVMSSMEDCGVDRGDVISCPPSELPAGYTSRTR